MAADPLETHRLEQLSAAHREMAGTVWGYYVALKVAGFSPPEALNLTIHYQNTLMGLTWASAQQKKTDEE